MEGLYDQLCNKIITKHYIDDDDYLILDMENNYKLSVCDISEAISFCFRKNNEVSNHNCKILRRSMKEITSKTELYNRIDTLQDKLDIIIELLNKYSEINTKQNENIRKGIVIAHSYLHRKSAYESDSEEKLPK